MSASIWAPGDAVNAGGSIKHEAFVATAGQTVFILNDFTYVPGSGALLVFVSGLAQRIGVDVLETSSGSFTLTSPAEEDTIVLAIGQTEVVSEIPVVDVVASAIGALKFLRVDAAGTDWEGRTAAQVLEDIGVGAAIQAQDFTAFTTAGTSTAYTGTPDPAITANTAGIRLHAVFHVAAGATPTLAVSGQAAIALKYRDSAGVLQDVTSSQIPANWESDIVCYSTYWLVLNIPQMTADTTASQAEMEAGTEAGIRRMSPLLVAQAIAALAGAGGLLAITEYTANGTHTTNANASFVIAIGCGGGQAGGYATNTFGAVYCGGAAATLQFGIDTIPDASYTVTIGAGGASNSAAGGNTTVGTFFTARGAGNVGCFNFQTAGSAGEVGPFGPGGAARTTDGNGTAAAANSGAGGGTGYAPGASDRSGGAGGSGRVFILEFA